MTFLVGFRNYLSLSYCYSLLLLSAFTEKSASEDVVNVTESRPLGIDGDNPLVSAIEGAKNVTFYCEVTLNGEMIRTQWTSIRETNTILLFNLDGVGQPGFENFMTSPNADFRRTLTILMFNRSFVENTRIGCGLIGEIKVQFDLRIIENPVLINPSNVYTILEGNSFNLSVQVAKGFPELPQYNWYHNDESIIEKASSPNISEYPLIIFETLSRNNSGVYKIEVTTEAGTVSTNFTLDVQFGVEGMVQLNSIYGIQGQNASLMAFTNVMGNPIPTSTWTKNNISITIEERLAFNIPGQLCIFDVMKSDEGNYSNSLMNIINQPISNDVQFIVLETPSRPLNVSINGSVGSSEGHLIWYIPLHSGNPSFYLYVVVIKPTSNLQAPSIEKNISRLENRFYFTGLWPATQYRVSVRALSFHFMVGDIFGPISDTFVFTTSKGAPFLSAINVEVQNAILIVSFELLYDGGSAIINTTISCVSGHAVYTRSCVKCGLQSVFGPVEAGRNYDCSVDIGNAIGSATLEEENAFASTGFPSTPVIAGTNVTSATIILHVIVSHTGGNTGLLYTVKTYDSSEGIVKVDEVNPSLEDFTGNGLDSFIQIETVRNGLYYFTVELENIYGSSMPSERSQVVNLYSGGLQDSLSQHLPSPTSTVFTPPQSGMLLVIGVSVSLVIATSIIVTTALLICCCLYRKSKAKEDLSKESGNIYDTIKPDPIQMKENISYETIKDSTAAALPIVYESPEFNNTVNKKKNTTADYITKI